MRYTTLGRSGTIVSTQCLGTMTFGAEADEAASGRSSTPSSRRRQLHRHRRRLQRAARPRRSSAAGSRRHPDATRRRWSSPPRAASRWATGRNDLGLSRRHLRHGARRLAAPARRRAHRPLPDARLGRADPDRGDAALPRRRRTAPARSRYYGFSNYLGWQRHQGRARRRGHGWAPPVTLQPQYNLLVRDIEHEVVPACLDAGIGLLPWSPLGRRLAHRQVPARRDADRRHPPRREPRARHGGLRGPRNADRAHLGDHRRRRRGRRRRAASRRAGRARLARARSRRSPRSSSAPAPSSSSPTTSARPTST